MPDHYLQSIVTSTSVTSGLGWFANQEAKNIVRSTQLSVLRTQGRALESAARVRGAEYLGEEVMTGLDRLRRHEARSAASDPVIADEYAAVRRAVLLAGLNEIDRFGKTW